MKTLTREEAEKLLCEIGHVANIEIPFAVYPDGSERSKTIEKRCVLNNGVIYNPFSGAQLGASSNERNAEKAMKFIKKEFYVYSSYFNWATGDYLIES